MATQTFEELIAGANKIKDNELPESNTHNLVGDQLLQMTNKMQEENSKIISSIFINYLKNISSYLKENYYTKNDGTIASNGAFYTYEKVPVVKGDTFTATFGMTVLPEFDGSNVVIFNSGGDVIETINTASVNYTFTEDGFISFCYNKGLQNTYFIGDERRLPLKNFTGYLYNLITNNEKDIKEHADSIDEIRNLSFMINYPKDISSYLKEKYYTKNDGTIASNGAFYTYEKVPVVKGDTFTATFGMTVLPEFDGSNVVIFNSGGDVIETINTASVNYTFTEDGFISFCYNKGLQNTYLLMTKTTLDDYFKNLLPPQKTIKWTAIGDSITAGNTSNTGTSYATFAADMLGAQVTLQKLGYWGHRIQNVLITTAFNAIDDDVDIVTMNLGSNDIYSLEEAQWGNVDEIIAKSKEDLVENQTTFENLRIFFEKMRETHPSTLIYVINPIKRNYSNGIQERFNEQEKKLCDYYSIPVLDAFNESGIRYDDTIYKADGIHPNDAGKLVYARWLVSKISFLNL